MGLINDLINAKKSSEEFDKVRGDKRPKWLKIAGDYVPGYSHYQMAKTVRDIKKHPKEGVQMLKDEGKVLIDIIEIAENG